MENKVLFLWLWPVSFILNIFLSLRYALRHGFSSMPSARFSWPNGQGTAKFFDGHKAAVRWRRELGRLYRIWDGTSPEIVLTQPHHLQQYFRHSHDHVKSSDNNAGWLFHELLGSCVGVVSRDQWRNLRKEVDGPFTRPAAMNHTAMIISNVRRFLHPFQDEERILDPVNDLKACAFFVVAEIFFGELSLKQRLALEKIAPIREGLFKHAFQGGVNRYPILRHWPGSANADLQQFQRQWETLVLEGYSHAQRQKLASPIVVLWDAVAEGRISKAELLQTLDESLFANLDVTAIAVSWMIIHLALHPAIQDELRQQLAPVKDDDDQYRQYLNRDDTLLAWCVYESARLKPILPFSNPESAMTDHIIDGYLVPKNVDVIVDTHAINVDNPFWGSNATGYDPHRFAVLPSDQLRYNLWRFGVGPRKCLGRNVADRLLRTIAAEMVLSFDMQTEGGEICVKEESWIGLPDTKVRVMSVNRHM
ncbi:hypothetical protein ASPZODRAFT_167643 [Penicilliopsis zonata CBS 506.65]|uniref:Cytochrome P450 n=1 Tax=Penicilliopsis zonata CBS 506.65 TaxID=1073090 RepID=A0A1L9SFY6_9EURO|nr:hypothetical protein ASPZODRAFT_167643 [Penicilliopsis zonata CBS 506.65]OJJ45944.1 hypothetical protein ASPZODRAFT_167643 [Penicilliopsis zonata CBS 506.65]